MKIKKSLLVLSTVASIFGVTLGLCSCGNNDVDDDPFALDLKDDREFDDEGNVIFEGVEIDLWTIIGDPDLSVYRTLIDNFNREYRGKIKVNYRSIGHYDFYNNLDSTWSSDRDSAPDFLFMHNEKTGEYANKGVLYPIDSILEETNYEFDFSNVYENIDRGQFYKDHRFGVPVDAHGFLTHFRQDIIKKNNLGFDNNTRFIPNSREEYQSLLERLKTKANSSEGLFIRNILKGEDHSWKKANPSTFYPEANQSTDPDGLGALYANGGTMTTNDGRTISFGENEGFKTYITDLVSRFNDKLMGPIAGNGQENFPIGTNVIFSEGPWWTAQNFIPNFNNSELKKVGNGVTEEESKDPVYTNPLLASNSAGFWTLEANKNSENGSKWYGNGHAFSLTRKNKSMTKALACLEFAKWFTQGYTIDEKTQRYDYNLAYWGNGGHIPAWKNVYESDYYKELEEKLPTLKALGDPNDIIAMEPLAYETTVFDAVNKSVATVISKLESGEISTSEDALNVVKQIITSAQVSLDTLYENE